VKDAAPLKFLDELILPFVILVAARYLGVFFATYLRAVQFSFGSQSDLVSVPFLHFSCLADRVFANLVSWFFVAVALAAFFGFILFRNLHFHQDWVHPRVAAHLHNQNLEFLIVQRKEAFYQALTWFCLTLVLLILAITEFLAGDLAVLVFGFVYGTGVSLIIIFLLELTRDKKLGRDKV